MIPRRATDPIRTRVRPALFWAAACLLAAGPLRAAPPVEGRVTYATETEVYIDRGTGAGLAEGDTGSIRRRGTELARGRIVAAGAGFSRLEITVRLAPETPQIGDSVVFELKPRAAPPPPKPAAAEEFVPLLETGPRVARARSSDIFHGRLRARHLFQRDPNHNLDYAVSRLRFDGSLDRLRGTSWSAVSYGDLSYRQGPAYVGSPEYQNPRLDLFQLSLQGRVTERASLRLGRFSSHEMSSLGIVDGAEADLKAGAFSLGVLSGFRPRPDNLDLSGDEYLQAAYAAAEAGTRRRLFYSATLGGAAAWFRGRHDRSLLLHDQQLDLGPLFTVNSSAELDFDVADGTAPARGTRLTRFNGAARLALFSFLSLQGGADHYRQADSRAERVRLGLPEFFSPDPGYWRYWAGAGQSLFWKLQAYEEISYVDTPDAPRGPARWRASLTRAGLPFLPGGQAALTAYNLYEAASQGYGGLASLYLPFAGNRLLVNGGCGFWYARLSGAAPDDRSRHFSVTDYSLRADWSLTKRWALSAGLTRIYAQLVNSTLVDTGLQYRW